MYNTISGGGNQLDGSILNSEISYSRISDLDYFDDFGNSLSTAGQSSVKREIRFYGDIYDNKSVLNYDLSTLSYQPSQTGISEQYKTVPSLKIGYTNKEILLLITISGRVLISLNIMIIRM